MEKEQEDLLFRVYVLGLIRGSAKPKDQSLACFLAKRVEEFEEDKKLMKFKEEIKNGYNKES